MSRDSHPTYYLDCCTPWLRGPTPSGRMERVHRFNCPVSPNKVVQPPSRSEVSSHAARIDPDADYAIEYEMHWRDRDDDEWTG
jgi:hypothetical protein